MNNDLFYNSLASDYDSMINFNEALERRFDLLSPLIPHDCKTAADIGCGSGIDAISLCKHGLKVVAFDPSEEMLNLARINAIKHCAKNIKFSMAGAADINILYHNKFDFVTSLGNTLSNIPRIEIKESVNSIYNLLKKNGAVVIQLINYSKLIAEDKRILNITKNDKHTFVRFYDFSEHKIIFNILKFENKNTNNHELISTEVFNYSCEYLLKLMKETGFCEIEIWGDLKKSPYENKSSNDVVIFAKK